MKTTVKYVTFNFRKIRNAKAVYRIRYVGQDIECKYRIKTLLPLKKLR